MQKILRKLSSFRPLVALSSGVRFFAAGATPLGADFVALVLGAVANEPSTTSGPMGFWTWLAVSAWAALPIVHPAVSKSLTAPAFQWSPELVVLVLLAKFPLILLDLVSALLIYKIVLTVAETKETAEKAALFWLFNPYVIFAVEMWGAPEILPITLTLLAIWLGVRGRTVARSFAFAAAVASKLFPAFLLMGTIKESLLTGSRRKLATEILLGSLGVMGYFVWSSRASGDQTASLSTYNPQIFVFDEFTVSAAIAIGLSTVALAVTWLLILQFWAWKTSSVIPASMAAVLSFLAFYNWYPAMLLWPLAFLALSWGQRPIMVRGILTVLTGAVFVLLSSQPVTLTSQAIFFVPVSEASSLGLAKFLKQIGTADITQVVVLPALRALFAALALMLTIRLHIANGMPLPSLRRECQTGGMLKSQ